MLVNVTIPVFNEERQLEAHVRKLIHFLSLHARFEFEVSIVDNGSTDNTRAIARELAQDCGLVRAFSLSEKGRGRAIKYAWERSQADVLSYMDVDLSTDLFAFPPLIEALFGGFDIAIGSRLLKPSLVQRGFKRTLISRCYNLLVKAVMQTDFSDAQCGFKGIRKAAAIKLIPLVKSNEWFFDSELLIFAERLGYRLYEVPVRWIDDEDSRVDIVQTMIEDLKNLIQLRWRISKRGWCYNSIALSSRELYERSYASHNHRSCEQCSRQSISYSNSQTPNPKHSK